MTYTEKIEVSITLQQGQNYADTLWLVEDAGLEQCQVHPAMRMIIGHIACRGLDNGYGILDKLCALPGVKAVDTAVIHLVSQ